jgi:2-polyprenyl-3-methyl-5-hydroxy-6-metoxy-1,4-benzoquinol methylase
MASHNFHDVPTGPLKHCQISGGDDLELVVDLGHQPLCDSLLSAEDLNTPEPTFPLRIMRSRSLGHSQLDFVVEPSEVFHKGYPYRCGVTQEVVQHHADLAASAVSGLGLSAGDFVVDIGSNDGTLLSAFKGLGMKVLGVEPTDVADYAIETNQVRSIKRFFTEDVAQEIADSHGPAKLVTATNVFAHVASLGSLLRGIKSLLRNDGFFLFENHYMIDILKMNQYDTFYHEHIRNYSLKSLVRLFEYYEMSVIDAEVVERYNGSIRVTVSNCPTTPTERVGEVLEMEAEFGLCQDSPWEQFRKEIYKSKDDLLELLLDLKRKNQHVVGNSCPGRCSTLLNFCGIGPDMIPYIAEQPHSPKLGLFLPGKHIPVISNEILFREQPDYVLLLAWHYAEPIMALLRQAGLRSRFIVPLPSVRVVD